MNITVCDRCGKRVGDGHIHLFDMDICEDCTPAFREAVNLWLHPTLPFKEHPTAQPKKLPRIKREVDWPKAVALKKAGWTHAKIADEFNVPISTINVGIYRHMKEGDEC